MGLADTLSARQLKYEAGSRRLCAFYAENRPIGSLCDSGSAPLWAACGSTPGRFPHFAKRQSHSGLRIERYSPDMSVNHTERRGVSYSAGWVDLGRRRTSLRCSTETESNGVRSRALRKR